MPLPQDLFRNYSRPFASNAILRLRCSSGFTVARGYGHMRADEQFDNLYHVPSCHSDSCFAVDLEFDSPSGATSNLDVQAKKKIGMKINSTHLLVYNMLVCLNLA